uniref:Uncharacterized protein n=1 Tax=Malurus cyaneus samueli TaxID=2593467 RepID=A0A8C5U8Z1_9PASS
ENCSLLISWAVFCTALSYCSRRAVTEHQLMHDKGRAFQGLKRLLWLHHALGAVHTASSRDIPLPNVQKSQDSSDFNSIDRDEASSLMKQLLELTEAQGFLPLKQLDGKIPKGKRLFEPFVPPFPCLSSSHLHFLRGNTGFCCSPLITNQPSLCKQSRVQFYCKISL